jgi:hypothetical protein
MAGIEMLHVPYRGTAPGVQDLIAGRVDMTLDTAAALLPLVREGRIRALAVSTRDPAAAAPELPPIARTLPGFHDASFNDLLAPARTPPETIAGLKPRSTACSPSTVRALRRAGRGTAGRLAGGSGRDGARRSSAGAASSRQGDRHRMTAPHPPRGAGRSSPCRGRAGSRPAAADGRALRRRRSVMPARGCWQSLAATLGGRGGENRPGGGAASARRWWRRRSQTAIRCSRHARAADRQPASRAQRALDQALPPVAG